MGGRIKFTKENARYYAARAKEARAINRANRIGLVHLKAIQSEPQTPDGEPRAGNGTGGYTAIQLARVRAHLDRVDDMLSRADDAQTVERLARARSALEEQERRLSDRSLPAVRRVADQRSPVASILS